MTIRNIFNTIVKTIKGLFTKTQAAVRSAEESFVEEPTTNDADVNVVADKVTKIVATVAVLFVAYLIVCTFPITILFILEMMAVYKAMKWVYGKVVAA